jgi:hypothetical protein
MKRLLLVLVVFGSMLASISMVSPAQAQDIPGLKLVATDCGGANSATWTCTTNSGTAFTAVASLVINAAGALTALTGEESKIEIAFQTPVPEWWQLGGACRAGTALNIGYNGGAFACLDWFGGIGTGPSGGNTYQIGPDAGIGDPNGPIDANRVRMRFISAVNYDIAIVTPPPVVGDELFLYSLQMNKSKSVGTGACVGCSQQACIMFKYAKLTQPVGVGDPLYNLPASAGSALLTTQFSGADCETVPVRSHTWGQIKSLYR